MSDTPPQPQDSITEELRQLGQNLIDTLRSAWDSPERKRLHEEVSDGLDELAKTIRMEANAFQESPTGQRIRSDVENLHQRIRTGEVETKLRDEMISALRTVNEELKKASDRWKGSGEQPSGTGESVEPESEPPSPPPSDAS
jgi:hypothetical protein